MRVFLIRHGRQSDARCNVDVDLAVEGRRQAELAAQRMEQWGMDTLYSSDLIRARQTAEIMNRWLRVPHHIVPKLRELDFGDMEGLTDLEIGERFASFQERQAPMDLDLTYPGGESVSNLVERVVPALRSIVDQASGDIAIATHGVVIRGVVSYVTHAPLARWRLLATSLENGSITELRWHHATEQFSLERLNDHAHLEGHPELMRSAWGVREN